MLALAPQDDAAPADAPQTTFGAYRLLEKIGEGGMGVVWRAQQEQPIRRVVALKVVKPGGNSREVLSRFESERQALAILNHPNIATVFDAGVTSDGRPYFVMETSRVRRSRISPTSTRSRFPPASPCSFRSVMVSNTRTRRDSSTAT